MAPRTEYSCIDCGTNVGTLVADMVDMGDCSQREWSPEERVKESGPSCLPGFAGREMLGIKTGEMMLSRCSCTEPPAGATSYCQ